MGFNIKAINQPRRGGRTPPAPPQRRGLHHSLSLSPGLLPLGRNHVLTLPHPRYDPPVRRLRRILLNAATVVSLLLFVATAALWVESYRAYTYVSLGNAVGVEWVVVHDAGRIGLRRTTYWAKEDDPKFPSPYRAFRRFNRFPMWVGRNWGDDGWRWAGFDAGYRVPIYAAAYRSRRQVGVSRLIRLPYWFVAAATLVVPSMSIRRACRERSRQSVGTRCLTCNYDLRATPDRCPECGTIPPG